MLKFKRMMTVLTIAAAVLATSMASAEDNTFPYRGDFPGVNTIGVHDLYAGLDNGEFLVVDVRSKLEFEVIHVDHAHHIPISKGTFTAGVKKLAADNPGKKIAFYCNGTTCLKSYKAAKKAQEAGVQDVYAFDGGIPEWAQIWPQNTLLLDKPIDNPDTQLISKAHFKARSLPWADFQTQAAADNSLVIDVRDNIQKSGKLAEMITSRGIPLDVFIPNFVAKGEQKDKTLLIVDQVGKQVKWLQYYLEEYGYESYFFLEGGAAKVLKGQDYKI